MTAKKRDQLHHDLVQQYLPGLIPNTIPGIIPYLGDPYDAKPGLGGMTAYPPMPMAGASRNEVSAPFQYAESLFATLAVVTSMTGLPYRHLQGLEDASIHEGLKSNHTADRIVPFIIKCAEHMVIKGSIHCHDYDEDVFPCVQF